MATEFSSGGQPEQSDTISTWEAAKKSEYQAQIPQDEKFWEGYLGEYLDRPTVRQKLGVSDEEFTQLEEERELLALPTSNGTKYPVFQFNREGKIDPTVVKVIRIFHEVVNTPYMTASFLRGVKFEGKVVKDWLEGGGDPQKVIRAAEISANALDQ